MKFQWELFKKKKKLRQTHIAKVAWTVMEDIYSLIWH